jgi:hypothetical protein
MRRELKEFERNIQAGNYFSKLSPFSCHHFPSDELPRNDRRNSGVKEGKGLSMSEHEESEDELTRWMRDLPSMELWVNELQSRVSRSRDPENPLEPERKFQELVNMAGGLLFLARRLLELATIANKAAESMTEPSREASGTEQRGPDS